MVETTVRDYDLEKNKEFLKSTFSSVAFIAVLHFYLGINQPLLIQSILPIKNTYHQPIVQIHLLGKKAVGHLERPFKSSSFSFTDPQSHSDKATIKKAVKASRSPKITGEKND